MSTDLVRRDNDAFELGEVFAKSGMFPNTTKAAEAIVKIIAGREFGLGPMAAMNGIHMVDGKPTLAANLIAGQIKRHPQYDYRVIRRDDTGCELEFFGTPYKANNELTSLGAMTFEKKDAERAGLLGKQNWRKYPRDMYFARCLTAGARTFCPDVLGGSPIYTAEELGADTADTHETPYEAPSQAAVIAHEETVADADVVPTVDDAVLKQLREVFDASGHTDNDLCFMLISLGVESLPGEPTKQNIGKAMRGLTLEQAFKLEALLKGEDDSTPGSGEAS